MNKNELEKRKIFNHISIDAGENNTVEITIHNDECKNDRITTYVIKEKKIFGELVPSLLGPCIMIEEIVKLLEEEYVRIKKSNRIKFRFIPSSEFKPKVDYVRFVYLGILDAAIQKFVKEN